MLFKGTENGLAKLLGDALQKYWEVFCKNIERFSTSVLRGVPFSDTIWTTSLWKNRGLVCFVLHHDLLFLEEKVIPEKKVKKIIWDTGRVMIYKFAEINDQYTKKQTVWSLYIETDSFPLCYFLSPFLVTLFMVRSFLKDPLFWNSIKAILFKLGFD